MHMHLPFNESQLWMPYIYVQLINSKWKNPLFFSFKRGESCRTKVREDMAFKWYFQIYEEMILLMMSFPIFKINH